MTCSLGGGGPGGGMRKVTGAHQFALGRPEPRVGGMGGKLLTEVPVTVRGSN